MTERNIGTFLKKNNAIFSYLKDSNGNRVGVILAVPSNDPNRKEPRIGYAFFNETLPDEIMYNSPKKNKDTCLYNYEEPLETLADSPRIVEQLTRLLGGCKEDILKAVKLPYTSKERAWGDKENLPCKISPRFIRKLEALQLARKRVNFFRDNFYELNDELSRVDRYSSEANIHRQIRKFEYRALRYYKYIPGLSLRYYKYIPGLRT